MAKVGFGWLEFKAEEFEVCENSFCGHFGGEWAIEDDALRRRIRKREIS